VRIAFFGSPAFAVPSLRRLAARHQVVAVYTQPDRPAGRGRAARPPDVKLAAAELGLPVVQPETVKTAAFREELAARGAEAAVVAAYGEIMGPKLLAVVPRGWWNVHASLLPRWRGASPVQWAILAGDAATGVSIMRLTQGLDEGPVLAAQELPIDDAIDGDALEAQLAALGAEMIEAAMARVEAGTAEAALVPQDATRATHAPLLKKEDGRLDWSAPARAVHDRVRALWSWPGAFTTWRGEVLKLAKSAPPSAPAGPVAATPPGTVVLDGARLLVRCGDGPLELLALQRPGKQVLPAADFLRGARLAAGERFGD
jgi:methionyl-tRNA formyltransferase